MIQEPTQTVEEWTEAFSLQPVDLEHLINLLLEEEIPLSTEELALASLRHRLVEEQDRVRRERQQSRRNVSVYLPGEIYEVGQGLVFPVLGDARGKVVAVREGSNPTYCTFQVIQVEFEDGGLREFAAGLADHPLNEEPSDGYGLVSGIISETPEGLLAQYGEQIKPRLESQLSGSTDIVRLAGRWFLRHLLFEINAGHLNLAEAVLDMADGGPVPTEEMLPQLGFPHDVDPKLQAFSLNYQLQEDERFDEVGPKGRVQWFLRCWEPLEVREPPRRLRYESVDVPPGILTPELLTAIQELDDEFCTEVTVGEEQDQLQLVLPFHHRRHGTLPLSSRLTHLFPTALVSPRVRVILVDGNSGEKRPGWVLRAERFVWGLGAWYEKYDVPAGAYLTVARAETAGEVVVTIDRRQPVSEWVRTAVAPYGQLRFAMKKRPIAVNYADEMIIALDDVSEIDAIWLDLDERKTPFSQIVVAVFRELVKLTPQGTVHAKTLYSAVNVVRRVPPGPVFAELVTHPFFEHVGDSYWRFEPTQHEGG